MSLENDIVPIKPTIVLTASHTTRIFDQTKAGNETLTASGTATSAPGSERSWVGGRLRGTIKAEAQAVELKTYLLTDDASATGDWEADANGPGAAGVLSIAAGTTQPFDWKINGIGKADIVNGATGPDDLSVMGLHWTPDVDPGQ